MITEQQIIESANKFGYNFTTINEKQGQESNSPLMVVLNNNSKLKLNTDELFNFIIKNKNLLLDKNAYNWNVVYFIITKNKDENLNFNEKQIMNLIKLCNLEEVEFLNFNSILDYILVYNKSQNLNLTNKDILWIIRKSNYKNFGNILNKVGVTIFLSNEQVIWLGEKTDIALLSSSQTLKYEKIKNDMYEKKELKEYLTPKNNKNKIKI